jgi:hypothetical protein
MVEAGLVWLARHQAEDGSWGAHSLPLKCGTTKCFVPEDEHDYYDVGLTSLAILAFLHAGYVPGGTKEIVDPLTKTSYKTAVIVTRALDWLRDNQIQTGEFASKPRSFIYNEALAELAMAEACTLVKDDHWKDSAQRGANAIVDAQRLKSDGKKAWGWRYESRKEAPKESASDADTSATGWCVVALSAAQAAGLKVPKESFQGALDFLDQARGGDGKVGYQFAAYAGAKVGGKHDEYTYYAGTMSALGILIATDCGTPVTDPFFDLAAKQILKHLPEASADGLSVDYYCWYHGTEALNRLDDVRLKKSKGKKIAEPWNEALFDTAFALQDQHADRCSLGGWVAMDRWGHTGGPVYATAMMILALEAAHPK